VVGGSLPGIQPLAQQAAEGPLLGLPVLRPQPNERVERVVLAGVHVGDADPRPDHGPAFEVHDAPDDGDVCRQLQHGLAQRGGGSFSGAGAAAAFPAGCAAWGVTGGGAAAAGPFRFRPTPPETRATASTAAASRGNLPIVMGETPWARAATAAGTRPPVKTSR